ncbi:flippase [Methanococcoides sp. SA1]|nr:flippase [Methanococcoides sp. SA1]
MFNFKPSKTMKDIQWSFISLATASLSHLLLRIVLGRELGPSGLGLYTLVFTIYMFGMQFAAFGIGAALTKYVAQFSDDQQKVTEFVSSGVVGSLISGSVMGILLYLIAPLIAVNIFDMPAMEELLKITAVCFPFIAIQKVVIGTLNGHRRMQAFALVNITQNVSVAALSIALVLFFKMDVTGAIIGYVAPTIAIGIVSIFLTRHDIKPSLFMSKTVLKEISWFGFYVVIANSIGIINMQIDSLMVGHFMNETEVGYYAVAIIFMQGVILLPQVVQRVTTPVMAKYYGKNDFESIRKLIKSTMVKTFGGILFISVIIAVFGNYLIITIFTEEFLPAYLPMLILLVGYSICAPIGSVGNTLSSVGKVNIVFKMTALCALMNTLLNLMLIPTFGLIGAASATSISQIITLLIHLLFIKKYVFNSQSI